MTAALASAAHLRGFRLQRALPAVTVAALAVLAAYSLVTGKTLVALAVALLPLAIWEATRLTAALVLLGLSLPAFMSVAGEGASVNIAGSDLLLVLIASALFFRMATTKAASELRALRPVAFAVTQYCAFLVLLLFAHFGANEVLQTAQRLELFLLPLIIGAFAALTNRHVQLIKAYVVAATLLAAVWPVEHFGMQKNPVGGMVGNAILLLIAFPPLRSFFPCLLILVPGLLLTESRGAVAATAVGLVIVALARGSRGRRLMTAVIPVALIATVTFWLLPTGTTSRLTTYSSGQQTTGEYALYIREQYRDDAYQVIAEHPWTGVGVGNYFAGDSSNLTQSEDPHQVLLLQAAEGGWAFAGSFVLLIVASCFALYAMRHVDIAPAAAAVFVASAAHGLVDVYWVRGTPVLAWLLLGMACGIHARTAQIKPQK